MPRTIWEWLEIEETTDRRLIRKAYARQAAKYHPEEAPEEAQQLREAYKRALALADRKEMSSDFAENVPADANEEISKTSPESDREFRPYDWERQEKAERESDAVGYHYGHQEGREEAEPETGQPRSYRYGHHEGREEAEPETGQSRNYRYGHQEGWGEAEPEIRQPRSYRYGHYEERKETEQEANPLPDKRYQYQTRQLDAERAERVHRLERRFIDLYGSPAYRYSGKLWSEAIKEYLRKEDLQDPLVIAILISLLGRMPGLDHRVWNVMKRELFRYARKEAEWIQLKKRFMHMRRLGGIRSGTEQETPYPGNQDGQAEASGGAGTAVPGKTKRKFFRVVLIAVAILSAYIGNKSQKEQEQEHRFQEMVNSMSEEVLITQRHDPGDHIQGYNTLVPYYIDLNDDGYDDMIRYEQESSSFVVEYYDPVTGEYVFQGTLDQYLEENPDKEDFEQLLDFKSLPLQE